MEDAQKLKGSLVGESLALPMPGQAEDIRPHIGLDLIVQADLYIVLHAQRGEKADVLEGACDAGFVHLYGVHAGGVLAIEEDRAGGGLIDLGEQVEDGSLSGAVRPDETGDLRASHREVEVVHRFESAEVDAEVMGLQHRGLVEVAFGDHGTAGNLYEL